MVTRRPPARGWPTSTRRKPSPSFSRVRRACSACWSRPRSSATRRSATSRPGWIRSSSPHRSARPNTSAAASSPRWRSTPVVLVAIPLGPGRASTLIVPTRRRFGPFRLAAYLQPFVLFLLPNLVLVGAILFTIGMLARQVIPVYLGAIGLFIGYLVVLNYGSRIASPMLSALADPLGISALLEMTRVLDGGRAEHAARRLSRDAGVEPRALARGRGGGARRCSTAGSGSRTPTVGGRRRTRSEPSSTPGARAGPAGARAARRRHRSDSGPRCGRRSPSHATRSTEIAASRAFVVALVVGDGPRPALGLERGRHGLRHVHVAGHAPRRRRRS